MFIKFPVVVQTEEEIDESAEEESSETVEETSEDSESEEERVNVFCDHTTVYDVTEMVDDPTRCAVSFTSGVVAEVVLPVADVFQLIQLAEKTEVKRSPGDKITVGVEDIEPMTLDLRTDGGNYV